MITAFSNPTLYTHPLPTWLQKHSLLLFIWHLIPPSPLPPLSPLCAGRALLQDLQVRWKVWGKQAARKHPCLRCGSPYPRTLSHPGSGAASDAAVLFTCCKLTQISGLGITLLRLPAHRGTSTPRTSFYSKGCFPSHVHIFLCQSCSNKLHISLQHRTNSVI